jgi:hypothetical protein
MQWLFLILSFVPAGILLTGWTYRSSAEPWAELFTLLLISSVISLSLIGWGLAWARVRRKSHRSAALLVFATLVASSPIVFYVFWILLQIL